MSTFGRPHLPLLNKVEASQRSSVRSQAFDLTQLKSNTEKSGSGSKTRSADLVPRDVLNALSPQGQLDLVNTTIYAYQGVTSPAESDLPVAQDTTDVEYEFAGTNDGPPSETAAKLVEAAEEFVEALRNDTDRRINRVISKADADSKVSNAVTLAQVTGDPSAFQASVTSRS
ncbi:MAG: hypothetical protein ACRCWJ_10605 [Casimicrobium sp.]